jgi:hypothetical protein
MKIKKLFFSNHFFLDSISMIMEQYQHQELLHPRPAQRNL